MADRSKKSVDKLVLHHAVTPLWSEKSKKWLADWFSNNGFARGYGSNAANWSGLINPYTGKRSYSMAHYAAQRVTKDTPDASSAEKKAGYRLVALVKDPFNVITWHAGNWPVNQTSIGIENLGDYRNYTLRDGDAKVLADFWRSQDKALGGKTAVYLHREVSQLGTECPARIGEMRNTIVKYINKAPSTPAPAKPKVTTKTSSYKKTMVITTDTTLVNIPSNSSVKPTISLKKGTKMEIADKVTASDGKVFYRTKSSVDGKRMTGVGASKIKDYVAPKPSTPKPVTPAPAPKLPYTVEKLSAPRDYVTKNGGKLWTLNFAKWADAKSNTSFADGTPITVTHRAQHDLGSTYYMRPDDVAAGRGFNAADLQLAAPTGNDSSKDEQTPVEQNETPQAANNGLDSRVGALEATVGGIIALLGSIGSALLNFVKGKK